MLIIGHRGARGIEPENTLRSFTRAVMEGVTWIEFDVQCSKDGVPMVIHDPTLDRTTNGTGWVRDKSSEELRSISTAYGERIPTLQAVVEQFARHCNLNVEIKDPAATDATVDILRVAMDRRLLTVDKILISSFDHQILARIHETNPELRLGLLYTGTPRDLEQKVASLHPYSLNLSFQAVTRTEVQLAHRFGLLCLVYTVNQISQAKHLQAIGVDGVFTDYPGEAMAWFTDATRNLLRN